MKHKHHVHSIRVTCAQGCVEPRSYWPSGRGVERNEGAAGLGAMFRARRCERCNEPYTVETIWADEYGLLDPGTPEDVKGRRRKPARPDDPTGASGSTVRFNGLARSNFIAAPIQMLSNVASRLAAFVQRSK